MKRRQLISLKSEKEALTRDAAARWLERNEKKAPAKKGKKR